MGGGYGMPCLYAVLGLTRDASADDVRAAYRREALKYYPDKQSTQSDDPRAKEVAVIRFQQIQKAYEVLSNPTKRAAYDVTVFPSYEPQLPRPFQFQRTSTADPGAILRDLTDKMIQQVHRIRQCTNLNMDETLARLEEMKRRSSFSPSASRSGMGATSSAGPQEATFLNSAGGKQSSTASSASTSHRYSPFSRKG